METSSSTSTIIDPNELKNSQDLNQTSYEHETRLRLIEANRSQQNFNNSQPLQQSTSTTTTNNNNHPGSTRNNRRSNGDDDDKDQDQDGRKNGTDDSDPVELEILLTNSSFPKKSLRLKRSTSIHQIKRIILENWPSEWESKDPHQQQPQQQGNSSKPIDCDNSGWFTLVDFLTIRNLCRALRLNLNGPSIIHLIIKPIEPDDDPNDKRVNLVVCSVRSAVVSNHKE
ncbi:expressed protein [Phakopsora pachyrhizi]|uniref:Expressed protein n=1 Tax=Phakopsora pachyrhizi TaxID=170000 RepID=A0AAV0AQA6_PHAPC|nr:expressed protein [Phakopsora pachyrhizi]